MGQQGWVEGSRRRDKRHGRSRPGGRPGEDHQAEGHAPGAGGQERGEGSGELKPSGTKVEYRELGQAGIEIENWDRRNWSRPGLKRGTGNQSLPGRRRRAELGPAGDGALLRVLTNHSLHQEEWHATQHGKETVRQQEDTCRDRSDFLFAPLRDAYRQNDMPRLNGSLRLPGVLPAARIDQL
ncbi:hypothetical protein EYF80_049352 [Liparis tanakae]|uniref:Uncharacterized protein n=1 Tax=Liparis tanakae TaxID=230148 RepID=A0A4Z2FI82_9TELE|nr:hypothetical protein EYF80_049352 [Liparis tanakae]